MKYCVYVTTYSGDRMPQKYVGSTNVERIQKGYKGSVRSKKWKDIWNYETKNFSSLFETEIISLHDTREDALKHELTFQIENDVVTSELWINESYAMINGFFGRNVSGENNPMFGKGHKIKQWRDSNPNKLEEMRNKNKDSALKQWSDSIIAIKQKDAMRNKKRTMKNQTHEEFIQMQKAKSQIGAEKTKHQIEYEGSTYHGWNELLQKTGVTKHLYRKYYINDLDPLSRKNCNGPTKQNLL